MGGNGDRHRRVDPRELLDRDGVRERVGAGTAVPRRNRDPEEAKLRHLAHELVRESALAIERLGERRDTLPCERPNRVSDELLFGGEIEVHAAGW